jgi:phage terminase small subunit
MHEGSRTAAEGNFQSADAPAPSSQPAPDDLKAEGAALWGAVTATYSLRSDELALLGEMCRTVDDLATMREALAADGALVTRGSRGQARAHPLLGEMRASRLLLIRLASQLGLPDDEEAPGSTPASRKAARAANERWRRQAVADGQA